MPVLFKLQLSKHRPGFGATVKGIPAPGIAGVWDEPSKEGVWIDPRSVRDCLPTNWRKAYDRDPTIWYPVCNIDQDGKVHGSAPYLTLRDRRGNYINTVYFIPYRYQPQAPAGWAVAETDTPQD